MIDLIRWIFRLRWYISGMAKERKSPQEKKQQEYTKDHFTFSKHSSFPKTWKRKKTHVNREYRRKSQELLVQAKPGMAADDVAKVGDNLTAGLFQKSIVRKPLQKGGIVTVGEKVRLKLAKREQTVGRRVKSHEAYDLAAASAISILGSLEGERLTDVAKRAGLLCGGNIAEWERVQQSKDPLDQALYFFHRLAKGSGYEVRALDRNQELCRAWSAWIAKVNRILTRDRRAIEEKDNEKKMAGKKLNSLRRGVHPPNI
jgi:hypothetical protein